MNCAQVSDQSKKNKLQWLQNPSQIIADYMDDVNVTLIDISSANKGLSARQN
jgi:hypothetical protein